MERFSKYRRQTNYTGNCAIFYGRRSFPDRYAFDNLLSQSWLVTFGMPEFTASSEMVAQLLSKQPRVCMNKFLKSVSFDTYMPSVSGYVSLSHPAICSGDPSSRSLASTRSFSAGFWFDKIGFGRRSRRQADLPAMMARYLFCPPFC